MVFVLHGSSGCVSVILINKEQIRTPFYVRLLYSGILRKKWRANLFFNNQNTRHTTTLNQNKQTNKQTKIPVSIALLMMLT